VADATEITVQVATPRGMALQVDAQGVEVPSVAGQFGVLEGHIPLLAAMRPGIMTYHKDGKAFRAAIGWGFAEADSKRVRLITEFYLTADQIDLEQAKKDRDAAEKRLAHFEGQFGDVAHVEAQRALDWALARIELATSASN
jgi:F-type H+-transporting ATPase subunit epsilon